MQCYSCIGTGHVNGTCPACHGKGSYFKVLGRRNVWEVCYQCGGKRHVNVVCRTCGGTGVLPDGPSVPGGLPTPSPPPSLSQPDPELLKLNGSWKGGGARYELVRDNGGYHVTMFNFMGWRIGDGEATVHGNTLTLTVKTMWGTNTADLHLDAGRLHGVTQGLLPLPFALRPA